MCQFNFYFHGNWKNQIVNGKKNIKRNLTQKIPSSGHDFRIEIHQWISRSKIIQKTHADTFKKEEESIIQKDEKFISIWFLFIRKMRNLRKRKYWKC